MPDAELVTVKRPETTLAGGEAVDQFADKRLGVVSRVYPAIAFGHEIITFVPA